MAKKRDFITLFNIDKIELIKTCKLNNKSFDYIDFTFMINNEIIVLYCKNKYILVSPKYFDILQIIEFNNNYKFLKVINIAFIQYFINDKKVQIIKQIYNNKKGYLIEDNTMILNVNYCTNYSQIIMIDNNEIFIGERGAMSIFNNVI